MDCVQQPDQSQCAHRLSDLSAIANELLRATRAIYSFVDHAFSPGESVMEEMPVPYNRQYTRNEVHDILCDSERRYRPGVPLDKAHQGHAISQHGDSRADVFDRREDVVNDGRFISRKDLVLAVTEALNTPSGQTELAKLATEQTVKIDADLVVYAGKIKAEVVGNPWAKVPKSVSKLKRLPAEGPQHFQQLDVKGVTVIVDRLVPPNAACGIHIQTAFPKT
jgi:hypothetical protein